MEEITEYLDIISIDEQSQLLDSLIEEIEVLLF